MKKVKKWIAGMLVISILFGIIPIPVSASTTLPSSIYLTQEGSSTCTLCSAAMMLRARMYLSGNNDWSSITESAIKSTAWSSGLIWNWTYSLNGNSMTVNHTSVSGGISISSLKSILDSHPEGIVLYVRDLPHAVFVTDYDGDTFYCADTISGYSGKRISLASSYLGKKLGSQASVLSCVDDYWYVSSYSIAKSTNPPTGVVDSFQGGTQCVTVSGWAFDWDNVGSSVEIHVYIGGPAGSGIVGYGGIIANGLRADVGSAYSGVGNYHGYEATLYTDLTGTQPIYVYAIDTGGGTENALIGSGTVTIAADTEAPVISNVTITDIDATGYTVNCTATDNTGVNRVQFPTWTVPEQDDIQADWETNSAASGEKNGNTYSYRVNISDHNNETEGYRTHIYAWDNYGNWTKVRLSDIGYDDIDIDTEAPVISNVTITNVNETGYTVNCTVTDNTGVNRVQFPTWTVPDQDDIQTNWATSSAAGGTKNGNNYSYRVNIADHNNETSGYRTHIYAWDNYGNQAKVRLADLGYEDVTITYTVSYNANGGSGAPASQTIACGTALTLSSTIPTREGHNFKGWSTSSSATSATYQPGDSYTLNSSVTLYAVWSKKTYTVSYNANGGTGAPSAQTKTYGTALTLSSTVPTREGYNFKGWSTSSSSTSATYQPGDSYTLNSSVTLYAIWSKKAYTVSYNANGGTGAPSAQTKTYGTTLTLSSIVPTREGYNFVGWSTSSNVTSVAYQPGDNYSDEADITLYAVWEEKENVIEGTCGENLTWTLNDSGILTVSGEGAMKNYTTKTSMPWYDYLDQIKTVVIDEGVTSIGNYAFYGMLNLKNITIAESVTSIGMYAFKNSTGLDNVELPSGLTQLGESAFYGCTSLSLIDIPASLYTVKPYTFKNCTSLVKVTMHEGNLQKLSDAAFYGTALTEVAIPDCVTIVDVYCFKNCTDLASITLSENLTEIREAVFYGTAISSIEIPEGATKIGSYSFKNCTKLTTINLPDTLTSIGEASFYACTALESMTLPDAVTSIGNYAFRKCTALGNITFSDNLVTIGESSFYGCTSLTKLNIPENVTIIEGYAFKGCTGLTSVSLPDTLLTLGESAFYECTGLSEITIPEGITSIGDYCFSRSTGLEKIIFQGNSPIFGSGVFSRVTATVYYPANNETWTSDVMQNYGGTITWTPVDENGDIFVTVVEMEEVSETVETVKGVESEDVGYEYIENTEIESTEGVSLEISEESEAVIDENNIQAEKTDEETEQVLDENYELEETMAAEETEDIEFVDDMSLEEISELEISVNESCDQAADLNEEIITTEETN